MLQTVVETKLFLRRAEEAGLSEQERATLVTLIAMNPEIGDVVPGTGGVRKVRFAAPGRGKSGSYRVITFYSGSDLPVFLISAYAKASKQDLTGTERNELRALARALTEGYAAKVRPLRR